MKVCEKLGQEYVDAYTGKLTEAERVRYFYKATGAEETMSWEEFRKRKVFVIPCKPDSQEVIRLIPSISWTNGLAAAVPMLEAALRLHRGESYLRPADLEPGADVRRGRRRQHGGPQQLLVVVPRRGQDGHRVQRLSLEPELPGALEDVPQLRVPEPVQLRALEDLAGRVFRVEQQAADDGLLGLLPGDVYSSPSTASF